MKHYQAAIKVEEKEGLPVRLFWKGRLYRVVGVEDRWKYRGKWWQDKSWSRQYFRLTVKNAATHGTHCFEVYIQCGQWVLSHVLD